MTDTTAAQLDATAAPDAPSTPRGSIWSRWFGKGSGSSHPVMPEGDANQSAEAQTQAAALDPMELRYRRARREWDERFAFHAQCARLWKTYMYAGVFFGLAGFGYAYWVHGQGEYRPFPVMIDDLGRSVAIVDLEPVTDWPVPVLKRDMADFVINLRGIPGDRDVLISNLYRALAYIAPGSPAKTLFEETGHHKTLGPLIVFETRTRAIEVVAVNFVGGNSWLVDWRETTRSKGNGKILSVNAYKGTFVLRPAARLSREIVSVNPLGILVEHYDIQRLN